MNVYVQGLRTLAAASLVAAFASGVSAEIFTNENGQKVECRDEQVATRDGHPVAAPLAGAVVGGVIGHQFGGGRGKDVATAAGAVGGAVAGKKIDENRTRDSTTTQRVCRPVE